MTRTSLRSRHRLEAAAFATSTQVRRTGHSARTFRTYLHRSGIKATIPERTDQLAGGVRRRERPCGFNKAVYRRRNVGERCFHRLRQWRGIATRYDKHPDRHLAALTLASTLSWLDQ
ncbi:MULTISPECIES: transposase [unclassified Streptomyces]|uniref:transposase n=1 Tax=unclassified Streptomyces TaxID=2593676 RepID=UPI00088E683D|nr:DDE family transposase [Streptomyces sp. 2321.6]SDR02302.1 Transposase DDE domain-containing protein [Streptomyces sp. KS_16]SED82947.1 Transposase DDE domain-containing protein [Streptomyces sp. 2133.1]SNC72799.1 Transposase DDE domain-containing protein [Streptomyces sp. 2114.4]